MPHASGKTQPTVVNGVLDLRTWDFTKDGPVRLNGEWEFYWKQFIDPRKFQAGGFSSHGYLSVPGIWNKHKIAGKAVGRKGHATYHLRVLLNSKHDKEMLMGLKIPDMSKAYRLYANGRVISSNGTVGTDSRSMHEQLLPTVGFFPAPDDNILDIVVYVSNYRHTQGGIWKAIHLGREAQILHIRERNLIAESALAGLIMVMGIYHLALFFTRRQNRTALYFGVYTLLAAVDCLIHGERLLVQLFPDIGYRTFYNLLFISVYLGTPSLGHFLRRIFPDEVSPVTINAMTAVCVMFTLFALFTPIPLAVKTGSPFLVMLIMICIYYFSIFIRAALHKRDGSMIILIGFVPLLLATLNDSLEYLDIFITHLTLFPYGFGICIFSQAYMLAIRFSKSFQAEEQLSHDLNQTKNYLNNVFNSLSSVLVSVDGKAAITQWNAPAESYTGIPAEEAIGQPLWHKLPLMQSYRHEFSQVIRSRQRIDLTRQAVPGPETTGYINLSITPLSFDDHQGAVIRIDDVSEMELKDQQLRQAQKMETVGNLTSGLAHDFNNVLGGIVGMISLIKHQLEHPGINPKKLLSRIDVIDRCATRATELVKQLLSLSRKQELAISPMDLNLALQQVARICQNTFDKSIRIEIQNYTQPAIALADQGQIEQVILNLCINAAHAMTEMRPPEAPQGGILNLGIKTIEADKSLRKAHPEALEARYWILQISDTGVGIDSKTIPKIFDPFFTTKEKGSGLGLAMVYNIIRQHRGFVTVYSEPGLGATFNVYLPVHAGATRADYPHENIPEFRAGSGLILVVDDEDTMRELVQSILEESGFTVLSAMDGLEGLNLFSKHHERIKGVILDMAMPRMSGKDAFQEIKKIDPRAKVMLTSGFKQDPRVQDVLAMGAQGFLQKPYTMHELLKKVRETFGE